MAPIPKNNPRRLFPGTFRFLRSILLAAALFPAAAPCRGAGTDAWQPVDQPGLEADFQAAPELTFEELADGPDTCWVGPQMWIQNPDGKTWDVVMWYYPAYGGPHQIFIHDFGTGKTLTKELKGGSVFNAANYYVIDGKLYIRAWGYDVNFHVYDPATNEFTDHFNLFPKEVTSHGVARPSEDGSVFYGYGITCGKRNDRRVGFYKVDRATMTGEVLGTAEPVLEEPFDYYDELGVDGDWVYVIVGHKPWRLIGMRLSTRETKVIAESEPIAGDHLTMDLKILPDYPGAHFRAIDLKGAPRGETQHFWLRDGVLTPTEKPGKGFVPPWADEKFPEPRKEFGLSFDKQHKFVPKGMQWVRSPIALDGKVRCFYRFDASDLAAACKTPPHEWRNFDVNVKLYPTPIRHMAVLPDKSIYAAAESYARAVRFWPATNKVETLGPTLSTHTLCWFKDRLYMTGYPRTQIWAYDPAQPWTVGRPSETPPEEVGEAEDEEAMEFEVGPDSNPAKVGELMKFTRAHQSFAGATVGMDGRIYYGCKIYRVGNGGALGWYDPATKECGGITEPFTAYPVYWSCGALDGRYVVLSTKTSEDDAKPGFRPERGRLFVFDVAKQEFIHRFEDPRLGPPGFVIEAKPGMVLGYTADHENPGKGLLYGFDVVQGKLLWTKSVPRPPETAFASWRRNRRTYTMGPDGMVWTNIGGVLTRINPDNAEVQVLGKTPPDQIVFMDGKAYAAGSGKFRRLILPEEVERAISPR